MEKPVILAVDDEPAVLSAVARDLRREYGGEYRVMRAGSAEEALAALAELKLRGARLALFLVDQRMPGISGVEFLTRAIPLFPDARRVLLTAYADTDAAIRAINEVRLDHYLLKPWDPPEEKLYPVLTDLLDAWQAAHPPPFEGIRVVGHRWSAASHRVKDFLSRNLVPFRWLDVEEEGAAADEARDLLALAEADAERLPLVLFPDGTRLLDPGPAEIAERLGLHLAAEQPFYDLIIVGGGPAGLAAAVYGASEGLGTLLVEREAPGGQAGMSSRIENYLGFPTGLSGGDLTHRAVAQARRFGAEILTPVEACALRVQDDYRFVRLTDGTEIGCRALIVASGVAYRRLEVPSAERLSGLGVYYGAALTEALAARGEDVFVLGAGNSAGQAAMYLSRFARSVTLLARGATLATSMSHYLIAQLGATENIQIRTHASVQELHGETHLEKITLQDAERAEPETLPAHALFIFIGAAPRSEWVEGAVERDGQGYILTGPHLLREGKPPRGWPLRREPLWLETSVPGIFAAGDIRHRSVKRIASAVGEGSMAVQFIHQYLGSL